MRSISHSKILVLSSFLIVLLCAARPGIAQLSENIDSSFVSHDTYIAFSLTPANIYALSDNRTKEKPETLESLELIHKVCQEQFGIDVRQLESFLMVMGPGQPDPKYPTQPTLDNCFVLRFLQDDQAATFIEKMIGAERETVTIGQLECVRRPGAPFAYCRFEPGAVAIGSEEYLGKALDPDADFTAAREMIETLPLDAEIALAYRKPEGIERSGELLLNGFDGFGFGLSSFLWPYDYEERESIGKLQSMLVTQRIFESDAIEIQWTMSDEESATALTDTFRKFLEQAQESFDQLEKDLESHRKSLRDSMGPLISATNVLVNHADVAQTDETVTVTARREQGFPEFFDAAANKISVLVGREAGMVPQPPHPMLDRR